MIDLWDNALFLRCRRERLRPHAVTAWVLMLVLTIAIFFVGCYLNREAMASYDYHTKISRPIPWQRMVFFLICVMNGFILLLMGTFAAARIAWQERTTGTIDFHRASPTPRLHQAAGLIFGGPVLEWLLFALSLPAAVFTAIVSGVSFFTFIKFYAGLILCAVLYHSLGVLFALCSGRKRNQPAGILVFLGFFYIMPLIYALNFSALYHLTWFPAYEYLTQKVFGSAGANTSAFALQQHIFLHSFFGIKLPFWLLQIIAQAPLLVIVWLGIKRKISYSGRLLFSKVQSAALAFIILFDFIGSSVALLLQSPSSSAKFYFASGGMVRGVFIVVILVLIFLCTPSATPTRLTFIQGLRRAKKLGLPRVNASDDQANNQLWLMTFCSIIVLACAVFFFVAQIPFRNQITPVLTLVLYSIFFANILEFFRLGPWHQKKILLGTGLAILWVIIPVFGLVANINRNIYLTQAKVQYSFAASPFFGASLLGDILGGAPTLKNINQPAIIIINAALCLVAFLLNRGVRHKLIARTRQDGQAVFP